MKYLKHFESTDDQFHIDQIRDIFQDIIDEYVIDAHTVLDRQFVIDTGFYYAIAHKGKTIRFVISVNFHDSEELNDQNILIYEKFKSLRVDIKLVNKRLKSMGYEFKELIIDDYPHSNNLIIYDFINIYHMKYLKHFENNGDDFHFHIQQIEDVFLDVKDEFGLDPYAIHKGSSVGISNGAYYAITKYGSTTTYSKAKKKVEFKIRLWIANLSPTSPIRIDNKITNSQTLRDFETRLKNMGYTFERVNSSYYDIIIYIP